MAKFTLILQNITDKSIIIKHEEASCFAEAFDNLVDSYLKYIILAGFEGHHKDISEEEL